jgi:hypothetical protein
MLERLEHDPLMKERMDRAKELQNVLARCSKCVDAQTKSGAQLHAKANSIAKKTHSALLL